MAQQVESENARSVRSCSSRPCIPQPCPTWEAQDTQLNGSASKVAETEHLAKKGQLSFRLLRLLYSNALHQRQCARLTNFSEFCPDNPN